VLGALIIAVAVVVVFAFATGSAEAPGRPYVVAARPLPAGSIIGPGDTTTQRIDLPAGPARGAFGQSAVVIGRTLAVAVSPGELIESSMLAPAGSGPTLRPVSVPVETTSLGDLSPGATVDVLSVAPSLTAGAATAGAATAGPATAGGAPAPATVAIVLRGATLLSVERAGSGLISQAATTTEVTLGVPDLAEAEAVIQAAQGGGVVLIQAEPSDGVGPGTTGATGTTAPAGGTTGGTTGIGTTAPAGGTTSPGAGTASTPGAGGGG
jgi:Flp pilus assembly protein CpaB